MISRTLGEHTVHFHIRPLPAQDEEIVQEVWDDRTYGWGPEHFDQHAVLDLGANIGAFSLWAAAAGAARVIAIEADPANYDRLLRNLAANPELAQRVRPIHGAAGPARQYESVPTDSCGGSWVEPDQDGSIPGYPLGDLLDIVEGDRIQVKCDIEGGEYELFASAVDGDLLRINQLVMEYHQPGIPGGLGENPTPAPVDAWGTLVTKLAETHELRTHGMPSRGGRLWAIRY